MNNYSILESHGFNRNQIKRVTEIFENDEIVFFLELYSNQRTCPFCNSANSKIKEYKERTIKGAPLGKTSVYINYKLPRYICSACNKTYTHKLSLLENSIPIKVINEITFEFSNLISFTDIAKRYNLTTTTVLDIFDKYCPVLNEKINEVLCIDEFSNIRNNDFKYACILVDFEKHKIIDIIKSRKLDYLRPYFSKIPLDTRKKVKYIVTDMYDPYITIAKDYFKNASVAIDPFHYTKYLTNAVQEIKKRLLNNGVFFFDLTWMNTHWRLLTMNPNNYPKENMTLKSGETISYQDRIHRFVKQDRDLEYAFFVLMDFYTITSKLTYQNALSYIPFFINNLLTSHLPEFVECGKTWKNYETYIINSFIKHKQIRLSNGPIEGINNIVKALKKIYYGYRNKERFYKRVILLINSKRS